MYYLINPFFLHLPISVRLTSHGVLLLQIHQNDVSNGYLSGECRGFFTLFMFIYSLYLTFFYINYNLFKKEYEYIRNYRNTPNRRRNQGKKWVVGYFNKRQINTKFFQTTTLFNDKGEIQFCFNEINSDKDNTNLSKIF